MSENKFTMKILGRTIEHLGTQMYKHRPPSIAELVANSWDAGSANVWIDIPTQDEYSQQTSSIILLDDGEGMDANSIQECYMVIGRNRRATDGLINHGRKVMGRKGIGKLAGFGLADVVQVVTWTRESSSAIEFEMPLHKLKGNAGELNNVTFDWAKVSKGKNWPDSGTRITLSRLKHKTSIDINTLTETLARRFSRTTRGLMSIHVNGSVIDEPNLTFMHDSPPDESYHSVELPSGKKIKYRYSFARKPIPSKEMQGFVVYANERTAQAPPFFFNVESTASSQHSTRYVTGEIYADYLDDGVDDDTDVISTDRQELDWEKEELHELQLWGSNMTRKLFTECGEMLGKQFENWVLEDENLASRIEMLDRTSQRDVSRFLKVLGQRTSRGDASTKNLADSLVRAFEFKQFHNVIDEIETASADPEKLVEVLSKLHDWKVLESRAILEIVRGRLGIINKLETMIIEDNPETASSRTNDNMHDLLAQYPWLINPEWQVFVEEESIGKRLRKWGIRDCPDDMKAKRVDFLAFARDTDQLVIIELKRPGHPVTLKEMQRLEGYQEQLMRARGDCRRVLVYGGNADIQEQKWKDMQLSSDFEVLTWEQMFARARRFYSHYEVVLSGDARSEGFRTKEVEVARTRQIIDSGTSYRGDDLRKAGLGDTEI